MSASILASWNQIRLAAANPRLHLGKPAAEWMAIAVITPLLLVVAFWNGFPLIFYDTGAYVVEGLGRHFLAERSPVYSFFLDFAGARSSLWIIVFIQALATSYLIVVTARLLVPTVSIGRSLLMCTALVIATGLPWYVGEVEPDCFAPLTLLAFYLLAFHASALGRLRSAIVFVIGSFAAAVHTSHILLGLAVWFAFGMFAAVLAIRRSRRRCPNLLLPGAALCVAASLVLSGNYVLTRQVFFTRAGPAFVFARLLQDGLVMRLLEDTCPRSGYRLCAYKDRLPPRANAWLWAPYSPFLKLGGFEGTRAESEKIIRDSMVRYPLLNIAMVFADAGRQFVSFRTGDQVEPQQWAVQRAFSDYLPTQLGAYLSARQQQGQIAFRVINLIHVPVGALSLLALAALLARSIRRNNEDTAVFLGLTLLGFIANAVICGALSNPHDRYQSRLVWLAPFSVALVAMSKQNGRRPETKGVVTSTACGAHTESPCEPQSNPALIDVQAHGGAVRAL